ncbi:MAG: GTP 3',8-cyclase MoaA [Alphaproteobacteria bacterium]|uniref:GTP 3',8-cyclase n=1 Tax=Candidatus Nitrobium versatile TaxID=2884831 RepID=A0A953M0M2_9BACT|nr:GTP 3',8-cyclase MoaA [Candidatus Nitrobium versatile]
MQDKYERVIDYLRISITDRCNLRCIYCMPSEGVKLIQHKDILRYEEIIRIVRVAADLGVRKVRLTGGEPLTRKDLPHLVAAISAIEGIEDISLTTNGLLLKKLARPLAAAGLKRVNVSLDSLRPERYREITRGGDIGEVLSGIEEAEKAGILPIKLNMVPIRGFNDDEIEDFARLTLKKDYDVRFIEFMPIGAQEIWSHEKYISTEEIRRRVDAIAPLIPLKLRKSGPARYFRFENAPGVIGFISPITHHFCGSCNRLRITSDGKLRPCLFSETEIDLKPALRSDTPDSEVERLLRLAVEVKPEGHSINYEKSFTHLKRMSKIGG